MQDKAATAKRRIGQSPRSPGTYRAQAQSWYSSRRWKARRLAQLQAEPLCAYCLREDKAVPATIADHKTPHRGDEALFWNGALQSLCKPHHDSVKKLEEGGKRIVLIGDDGWPL